MVNMVELLLNMEVREDISADIITASIKPEKIWEVIEVFNNIFEMGDWVSCLNLMDNQSTTSYHLYIITINM